MKTDYKTVKVELKDGAAIFGLNNPPVNQLSEHFVREMADAFTQAWGDPTVKAIILTGTGKNFIAGADITQIQPIKDKSFLLPRVMENNRFINAIEEGPKPVIAAINGNCLGGGLEIAMACHYRVAAQGVQIGQPEVQIGLIPGAGGTQRLARLVGFADALTMITTGNPISADEGLKKGALDEVVAPGELLNRAKKVADRFISGELNHKNLMTRNKTDKLPRAEEKKGILAFAKGMAAKQARGYLAPFKAIEAMERGLTDNFEADLKIEAELFTDCAVSDIAKNLIGIFLNTRAAGRLPRIEKIEPKKIKTVAMLGGGVMGSGIVNLLLRYGFEAFLWDINEEAGSMTEEGLTRLMQDHLRTTTSLEDLKGADLVIEAVLENMKIKQDIWKKLEGICRSDTVFGTNTSALPISELASVLTDPGRMIGLHFFNPAERMQLLEIICGKKTSDQTLATSVAFGRAIRKVPIVVNDGPGFYVSRQLGGLMGGSAFLIEEGVDPAKVEQALLDFGLPMGPATLSDLTGIDINYHVGKTFEKAFGKRWEMSPLMERVYQTGFYGRKTKAGWFDYSGEKPVPNPKMAAVVQNYLQEKGVKPKEMTEKEIVDRMLARAINEAAYMIQEGICDRPQDMDLAMVYGTGFPPYRGGILRYADAWGIKNVYDCLLRLEKGYGEKFKPCSLLKEMAEKGKTFYKY
ncbi:MAG: 3-hydroxyacyl-CoA dehydrogenase [Deltaproteobacteria bacterium]|nr:3-hydroxyacyl-CoA dehydrogenase [Deltaproteobacteria bacterium]